MADKTADHGSRVALDFGRLLGFKRLAVCVGNEADLARVLGAACNKAGAEGPPPAPAIHWARALGAACAKVSEVPSGPTKLARALGAGYNKIGEATD